MRGWCRRVGVRRLMEESKGERVVVGEYRVGVGE